MANLNTVSRYFPGRKPDLTTLEDLTDAFRNKDNAAFLAEVAGRLSALRSDPTFGSLFSGGAGCVGLIGEYGLIGYSIRQAEELVRVDNTPSYWSHAYLHYDDLSPDPAVNRNPRGSPWIWESTLEPASLFNHFFDRNGVGPRRMADYARSRFDLLAPHSVPNIAVLAIGLTPTERAAILDRANDPDVDQLNYDLPGLLGTWYAYITNRADRRNPLSEGHAIYCSAYVQLAYDAVKIDLAPGAHQRNTSPEHLWQTARYLADRLPPVTVSPGQTPISRPVHGWYCARDEACVIAPVGLSAEAKAARPRTIRDVMSLQANPSSQG
jgi:hypothetical protein